MARGTCPDGDRERGAIEIEPAHGVTSSSGRSTELEWVMGGRMHALAAARRSIRIGTRGQHVCEVSCEDRSGVRGSGIKNPAALEGQRGFCIRITDGRVFKSA